MVWCVPLAIWSLCYSHRHIVFFKAVYEREPDAVKATPELVSAAADATHLLKHGLQLRENLFEKQYAQAFLAFKGTPEHPLEPIGMALYFYNFSTWTGESSDVRPECF